MVKGDIFTSPIDFALQETIKNLKMTKKTNYFMRH